ncbi:MAG: hypothetical protein Q4P72_00795 [Eubacteriales bacterium]|nr:hypothetical protein [Eubacteriales bacterium]
MKSRFKCYIAVLVFAFLPWAQASGIRAESGSLLSESDAGEIRSLLGAVFEDQRLDLSWRFERVLKMSEAARAADMRDPEDEFYLEEPFEGLWHRHLGRAELSFCGPADWQILARDEERFDYGDAAEVALERLRRNRDVEIRLAEMTDSQLDNYDPYTLDVSDLSRSSERRLAVEGRLSEDRDLVCRMQNYDGLGDGERGLEEFRIPDESYSEFQQLEIYVPLIVLRYGLEMGTYELYRGAADTEYRLRLKPLELLRRFASDEGAWDYLGRQVSDDFDRLDPERDFRALNRCIEHLAELEDKQSPETGESLVLVFHLRLEASRQAIESIWLDDPEQLPLLIRIFSELGGWQSSELEDYGLEYTGLEFSNRVCEVHIQPRGKIEALEEQVFEDFMSGLGADLETELRHVLEAPVF